MARPSSLIRWIALTIAGAAAVAAMAAFAIGLVAVPGAAIAFSMSGNNPTWKDKDGSYIVHRDYTTSQQLNARIDAGDRIFTIRTRGACWRLTIVKP